MVKASRNAVHRAVRPSSPVREPRGLGCAMPWASTSPSTTAPEAVVNQAMLQVQTALGLPDGAISRSSQPPLLGDSDVALGWLGGRADVDLTSGHISAVLVDSTGKTSGTALSDTGLNDAADRVVGLLGWDSAALQTQGFTPGDSKTVDYAGAGPVYKKSWVGHDSEGVPNEGVIEIGLDATTGDLHSFLFNPGPTIALDMSKTITKDEAIKTAKDAATKSASSCVSTSDTSVQGSATTNSSTTSSAGGGSTQRRRRRSHSSECDSRPYRQAGDHQGKGSAGVDRGVEREHGGRSDTSHRLRRRRERQGAGGDRQVAAARRGWRAPP